MVKIRIILSLLLAIVGYLLGLVAEANHYTETTLYMASCFLKIKSRFRYSFSRLFNFAISFFFEPLSHIKTL